jgi:hypothetical protein
MTISQVANLMSIPIAIVCFSISIRAFYIYNLSRSDMLFVLGLSMASIAVGTLWGPSVMRTLVATTGRLIGRAPLGHAAVASLSSLVR